MRKTGVDWPPCWMAYRLTDRAYLLLPARQRNSAIGHLDMYTLFCLSLWKDLGREGVVEIGKEFDSGQRYGRRIIACA